MTAHDKSLNAIEKSITQPLTGQDGEPAAKPESAPARSAARDSVLDGEILGAAEAPAARRAGPDFVPTENGARAAAAGMPVDAPAPERAAESAEAEPAKTADGGATASDPAVPFAVLADGPAAAPAALDGGRSTARVLGDDLGAGGVMALPTDHLFSQQWHLVNNVAGQLDLNLAAVWDSSGQNYTGQGVDVAVVDTGYDRSHHEFSDFDFARDRDWLDNDFVAEAVNANENHGTAVMGIIGADRDNNGTVGVAYDATLIGYRIGFGGADFLPNIISSLNQMVTDNIEVINMSIGLLADFVRNTNTNDMETAINNVINNGRGGLGGIIVKSAGNGRNDIPDLNDDTNGEILAADRGTISVAAVGRDGTLTSYSTHGASNLISAFGSEPASVVTTDRRGADGYNGGGANPDYTFSFNGTSAAAPMVAGVVALMLEANSSLGWRDVQDILAYSARHVGTAIGSGTSGFEEYAWVFNGASDWNGGGLHFNSDYGFGLIDAHAAVRLAETWGTDSQTSANDATEFEDVLNSTVTITGFGTNSFTITPTTGLRVEHIEVDINFIDWYDLGDLEIELISPDGTSSLLIDNTGEDDGTSAGGYVVGGARRWEFFTNAFRGEDASGSWTLNIRDGDSSSVSPITINDIDITFYGAAASNDDRFIVTEELSDYAGLFGHSTNFAGGAGDDTLNAAAVSSDTLISLLANTGTIDGVAITNSNIEHVFTGDGDDTILGDGFGIHLSTGRGNDSVDGGSANETIEGGAGNDTLEGGIGNDTINGGTGADQIEGEAGDDILNGGAGNDSFVYRNGQAATFGEVVTGGSGNDRVLLWGAGTYNFGAGSDMFDVVGIEEIEFRADGSNVDKTIILGNKELDSASEFMNAHIDGNASNGSDDTIIVNLDFSDNVDLSGWTFQDWNSIATNTDQIFINGNANANNIVGTSEDDTIVGGAGTDTLSGGGGNDLITSDGDGGLYNGNAGDDTLVSGLGAETMDGGAGIDTIDHRAFNGNYVFNLATGMTNFPAIEQFTNFENALMGNGNDSVTGSAANNMIDGGGGNDTIRGEGGTDTIIGGAGNDLIIVDGGDGLDDADGGTGTDTLDYSGTGGTITFNMATGAFDFGGNARTATNFENFLSGSGNDSITGSAAANLIDGGGGNDTIRGEGGTDTVNGGAGNDLIIVDGGDGLDDADGGTGTDTLDYSGTGGNITFNMGTGAFDFGGNARTATNFENFLSGSGNDSVTGTGGANLINGGAGNDTLVGASGIDTLIGGSGNDVFINNGGEFIDDIFGDAGTDTLDMSGYTFNFLTADLTAQTYTVGGGAGVQTLASVENVIGMSSNDVINGSAAANVIDGGAGDDDILGQDGDDTIIGGIGDDTVGAGLGDDSVNGNAGNDRIFGAGGQDTVLGDDGNDFLHGGGQDDLLGGGAGNDTLDGAFGNDTLFGGGGDDDMDGGGNDDRLVAGGGNDTMQGGDGADTLRGGNGNDTGFGGDGDDNVNGDNGNDFLRGGAGNDRVSGGAGFDTVFGDGGNDNVLGFGGNDFLRGGAGNDLVGGSFGNDLMFGDAGADRLFGGDANDTMFGGDGNDLLFGQQGADQMAGNAGADIFVYQDVSDSFAGSRDTITDFASGLDHMNLIAIDADTNTGANDAFTFIGGAGFSATAGELRFVTNGVDGFVLGDVDGDASSDFVVLLSGVVAMNAGDFFL